MAKVNLNVFEKILMIISVIGFVIVDSLFFHDIFKPGEIITFPQILTGILSVFVFIFCISLLFKDWLK